MKLRYYLISLVALLGLGILVVLVVLPVPDNTVDVTMINDIIRSGGTLDNTIFANTVAEWEAYRARLQLAVIVILFVVICAAIIFLVRIYIAILRPFTQMSSFAHRVAAGDLDIPLEMDKRNNFGAFTESFDLMRDELRRARQNEYAAEQAKRELVVSLSHDIQTPLASIQAVGELMAVNADDTAREKLQIIQQKANQIHTLVTDLFHATLDELHSLTVTPVPYPSDQLADLIKESDHRHKVVMGPIPQCLLQVDPIRLKQVFDNIIANSYKYADTAIEVSANLKDRGLVISLSDHGPGVPPEELPLLFNKYYRGSSVGDRSGYGLGLYIAHTLITAMSGQIECENSSPGFTIKIWLPFDI